MKSNNNVISFFIIFSGVFMRIILASILLMGATLFSAASFAQDKPKEITEAKSPPPPASTSPAPSAAPEPLKGIITNSLISDAPLPSDHVLGSKDAKVLLIEYASLSCPHCAHFYGSIMPDIKKKYIDTGKIRYILRQFPLNEPALVGAILVNCVGQGDTDKYYLFNSVLFDAQSKWAFDGNWKSALETISAVGGVSKEQFNSCINNKDSEMAIIKAKKIAMDELHVSHTPYFFIGGEAYNGDITLEDLSKFIDSKLNAK